MDEGDYKELVEFLIQQLTEKEEIDFVNQIKEVAASKVTMDTPKIYEELTNIDSKSKNSKSDYKDIGKIRLRNLTNKEIFSEAVEILTNYLQTTPKMAHRISVLFKTDAESIIWKFDKEETLYKDQKILLSTGRNREMKQTIKDIEEILKKAKAVLQKIYGKRLKGIILYGSYARGEAVEGSDIDLIVLLDNMEDPLEELEKCSKQIHQLDLAYDTLISMIPFDLNQYNTRKLPIIMNAKKEGIPI